MTLVSDEVWRQLDPGAGRLPRRTVLRLRWTISTTLALALLVGLGWRSGVVLPRLGWPNDGEGWSIEGNRVEYSMHIANRGWTSVEVLDVGRSGPGFVLDSVRAQLPTTLRPGESMEAVLIYRVTDCAAVPAGEWPVPVTVKRPWGTATGYVLPPPETSPKAPQWQRALADVSCAPR